MAGSQGPLAEVVAVEKDDAVTLVAATVADSGDVTEGSETFLGLVVHGLVDRGHHRELVDRKVRSCVDLVDSVVHPAMGAFEVVPSLNHSIVDCGEDPSD